MSYWKNVDIEVQRLEKTVAAAVLNAVDNAAQISTQRNGATASGTTYTNGTFNPDFTPYLLCDIVAIDDGVLAP